MLWWCSRYISKCNMRGIAGSKNVWLPFNLFFFISSPAAKAQKETDQKVKCSVEIEASFAIMTVERKKFQNLWSGVGKLTKWKERPRQIKNPGGFSQLCEERNNVTLLITCYCCLLDSSPRSLGSTYTYTCNYYKQGIFSPNFAVNIHCVRPADRASSWRC